MSSLWLSKFRRNVTSQNGEDGVIAAIFSRIGHVSQWCCEFGAWDGRHLSNTCALLTGLGWSGVLIEADPAKFKELERNTQGQSVTTLCRCVDDLDAILAETAMPFNFDLLSIDVDDDAGREVFSGYGIWKRLETYRPRVVVIEVNSGFDVDSNVAESARGTAIRPMVELAKSKGYELALHTGNAIFVSHECCEALDIDPENWQELFDRSWLKV